MKNIFFLNSWGEDPNTLLRRYSNQTPEKSGVWKDLQGVSDISKADYFIILGGQKTDFGLSKGRTLYIKREPDFIEKLPYVPYHHLSWKDKHCGITWWVNKSYDELIKEKYPEKKHRISCIASSKHTHRLSFLKRMSRNCDIHLYGRGHSDYHNNGAYKGSLEYNGNCKLAGLQPYEYTVVLENSQEKNYWTEKLADAFLSWSVPVYWGCPNISDFFEKKSYHTVDIDDPAPGDTIEEIIHTPVTCENIEALEKSRRLILEKYNIWEVISEKIQEIESE